MACLVEDSPASEFQLPDYFSPVKRRRGAPGVAQNYNNSTECPTTSGPIMQSASAKTFCSDCSTCCSSLDSVTTPTTERCQVSMKSSSATATLNCARKRSFKLRRTC